MIGKRKSFKRAIWGFSLALVASLALSAAAAGSASAATQHWYAGGTKLAEGTSTNYTMKGTTNFVFTVYVNGSFLPQITCTSMESKGTMENPTGGGAGVLNSNNFEISNCTYKKIKSCSGYIVVKSPYSVATEFGGKPAVKFTESYSEFIVLVMQGTECLLNSMSFFGGSFTTTVNNATSSLEFTAAGSEITYSHSGKTRLEGTSKIETTGGQAVTVAP
jgi:hypothetical protein